MYGVLFTCRSRHSDTWGAESGLFTASESYFFSLYTFTIPLKVDFEIVKKHYLKRLFENDKQSKENTSTCIMF